MIAPRTSSWSCSLFSDDIVPRRIEIALATDRPDRFEAELSCDPRDAAGVPALDGAEPGRQLRVTSSGEGTGRGDEIFSGVVAGRSFEMRAGLRSGRVVAYARYESSRLQSRRDVYYQMSDGEIAARIACELGLEPRVERTHRVHERLERHEDPLRFLRRRARAIGFELAIAEGRLWFCRRLPGEETVSSARPPVVIRPDSHLLSVSIEQRGACGGEIEITGDDRIRPLGSLDLEGFGSPWDRAYRVLRCVHRRDDRGFRSSVTFLEGRGLGGTADWSAWKEGLSDVVS